MAGSTPAPNGAVTSYTYDRDGHVLQRQQSANGAVLRTASGTYTPTGQPATTVEKRGHA